MQTLFIILLTLCWSAGSMFLTADHTAQEKGWLVSKRIKILTIVERILIYPAWILLYPTRWLYKLIFSEILWKNRREFEKWSLFYLAWSAQIATPFLALLVAPWYTFFIVLVGGFLLASYLSFIFLKSYTKNISELLLLFLYIPIVYILLR